MRTPSIRALHRVLRASSAAEARSVCASHQPDLVILELLLPDEDGLLLLDTFKSGPGIPIIVCSRTRRARAQDICLKLGADDFVSKPFDPWDVMARAEAVLQRGGPLLEEEAEVVRVGDLVIDEAAQTVRLAGQLVPLTATERGLLSFLAAKPGMVQHREAMIQHLAGQGGCDETDFSRGERSKGAMAVMERGVATLHYSVEEASDSSGWTARSIRR